MAEIKDWLQDPLRIADNGSPKCRKLKKSDEQQNELWFSFHFATRLKLDGADYFARQALGAASRPYDLGFPLLAHRLLEWHLDAFFFELMSAYDTLFQELNVVYAYDLGLKPEGVRWNNKNKNKFMKKLPENIFKHIKEERKKDWFCKVQSYRNTATHHYTVPLSSNTLWVGNIQNYYKHEVEITYFDKAGTRIQENIRVCPNYIRDMVWYIGSVWKMMAQEFE